MRGERGSVTLWVLGLSLAMLMLGGIALDLWRGLAVRREVAAVADAAAVAAASGIDEAAWRSFGVLRIHPEPASEEAHRLVALHPFAGALTGPPVVVVAPDGSWVSVTVEGRVEWSLLRLVAPGETGARVRATGIAEPRLLR
jgi:hypothetical protein